MSKPEQTHIVSAFAFELAKVEAMAVRTRMLGHLMIIEKALGDGVEQALGMVGMADTITPAVKPIDLPDSPALSLIKKAKPTLAGRKIAVLVTDGAEDAHIDALRKAVEKEGAALAVVAPKIGGITTKGGKRLAADQALSGAPSVLFDAVVLLLSPAGAQMLAKEAGAVNWLRDAFGHLKVIGHLAAAAPLFDKAAVTPDAGVIDVAGKGGVAAFINAAKRHRVWDREPSLRSLG